MASRYEVELTITSARDLKNVNWRHGELRPYAVAWIEGGARCSTKVDVDNGSDPIWDEKLLIPLPPQARLDEAVLYIDVVHVDAEEGVKPLVGSARLPLRDVVDEVGIGSKATRSLKLKRPSGRPHGKLEVKVAVKEPARYYDPYAPPYGQSASRGYDSYGYGQPYASAPPPSGYPYPAPYPYGAPPASGAYGEPPSAAYGAPSSAYGGAPAYGSGGPAYGTSAPVGQEKKSKFGMGTGLAVGAAAGVLGGLALAEGVDYVEDKIEDGVAERVEDDLAYDDGGYGGDDF
ncbi:protein SRC2 homolog [Typha latifolia]|uniref:protein SRC2 homolog n=1 Tax=Typha latifolia TaxID=4733 RepID=UPI003C30DC02